MYLDFRARIFGSDFLLVRVPLAYSRATLSTAVGFPDGVKEIQMLLPRMSSRICVVILAMFACFITLAATAAAQTETVLYTFTGTSDGAVPQGLVADAQG